MANFVGNNGPWGRPGVGNTYTSTPRQVTFGNRVRQFPGGGVIDASARDPGNTGALTLLRAGLLMGKITATGQYSTSVIGLTSAALTGSATTLTVPEAVGDEIVRRFGASGTFKLTGPPSAAGTVRTLTITYSAVATASAGTRVITITAAGVNQVDTVNLVTASTGGSGRLYISKADGTRVITPAFAWSATDATLLSNLQTALDTATGVANAIVATAIPATDTDLGFVLTYSGTGYAGGTFTPAAVHTLFTSNTGSNVVPTTAGVNGAFVTASMVQPGDGSENMLTFIPDGTGRYIDADNPRDIEFPDIITAADIDVTQLLPWPADTSIRQWILDKLNTNGQNFFSNKF